MFEYLKQIKQIDVLVIGGGNAGLCAAIAAACETKHVLVIEKANYEQRGGNSSLTMNYRFAHSSIEELLVRLKNHYIAYPENDFYSDLMNISNYRADSELSSILVKKSYETIRWLRTIGHIWEIKPRILAGSLPIQIVGGGRKLQNTNFAAAENRDINIVYGCELIDLIAQDNNGGS